MDPSRDILVHYVNRVRNAMLERIVMFGGDDAFVSICREMACELHITNADAAGLLWPTTHAIYRAAECVNIGRADCAQTVGPGKPVIDTGLSLLKAPVLALQDVDDESTR